MPLLLQAVTRARSPPILAAHVVAVAAARERSCFPPWRKVVAGARNAPGLRVPNVARCLAIHAGSVTAGCPAIHARNITVTTAPQPHVVTAGASSSSSTAPPQPPQGSKLKRGLLIFLKGLFVWFPALFFWASLVMGAPLVDLRTDEEIQEEENEVKRLERFFGVEGLSEAEYLTEWTTKEEALSQIVEKVLRSRNFMDTLVQGPPADGHDASLKSQDLVPWSRASRAAPQAVAEAEAVEVSYVLPPPQAEDEDSIDADNGEYLVTGDVYRRWLPRLVLAHRGGGLALLALAFERVARGKDNEERWACTSLQGYLVLASGGEATSEEICDLCGPVPHGVRYMRI